MLQLQPAGSSRAPTWLVKSKTTIGCAAACDVVALKENVEPIHAEVTLDNEQAYVFAYRHVVRDDAVIFRRLLLLIASRTLPLFHQIMHLPA